MHFSIFATEYIHNYDAPHTADSTTHTHTHTHTHSLVIVTSMITFTHGGDVIIGELSFTSVRVTVTVAVP